MPDDHSLSNDTLFSGTLVCRQHRNGYRFSIDAVLLAHSCTPKKRERVLDLGAGCGVVSLILAHRWPTLTLSCLEIQKKLVALARDNVSANGLAARIEVTEGDLRQIGSHFSAGSFDAVVCNPPFYKGGTGRINPQSEQAVARHEIRADLDSVLAAAAFAVKTRGRVALVYPADRLAFLLGCLQRYRLEPKRLRLVYSYPASPGRLVLIEAVKCGGEELTVLPALFIYRHKDGDYTEEVARFYEP